jgi:hypothetical protein
MAEHILNRRAPPSAPKPPPEPKLTADQAKAVAELKRTKAAEAVGQAIQRGRR